VDIFINNLYIHNVEPSGCLRAYVQFRTSTI